MLDLLACVDIANAKDDYHEPVNKLRFHHVRLSTKLTRREQAGANDAACSRR
jgi:hypothetical protein